MTNKPYDNRYKREDRLEVFLQRPNVGLLLSSWVMYICAAIFLLVALFDIGSFSGSEGVERIMLRQQLTGSLVIAAFSFGIGSILFGVYKISDTLLEIVSQRSDETAKDDGLKKSDEDNG